MADAGTVTFGITGLSVPIGTKPTRLEADCTILVSGEDVTAKWDPRLISVTVLDVESGMDEAVIELDDSEGNIDQSGAQAGRLTLPKLGAPVIVRLGWPNEGSFKVFTGYVWDLESMGQKRSGRRLRVEAKGAKQTGKQRASNYWGDDAEKTSGSGGDEGKTLQEVMTDSGKTAGYTVNIDPELGAKKEKYWIQNNESFHQFGERIARQYGGVFKVQGSTASITKAGGDSNATGQKMSTVSASAGWNLIAWRIKPFMARPVYGKTRAQWYDRAKGVFKWSSGEGQGHGDAWSSAKQIFSELWPQGSEGQSKEQAAADGIHSGRARGQGWIVIDGEPQAQSQGKCKLAGARPGVDGLWTIRQVEHQYSRSTGFTTRLDVVEPTLDGSGQDYFGE